MTISNLKDVRRYAEDAVRGLEIFGLPRIEALLHILRYVQAEQVVFENHHPIWTMPAYHALRSHQDILRHLVFKIHQWCPAGGDIGCLTQRADMERAETAVGLFEAYSVLQEFIENTEGKFSTFTITDSVIQFSSLMSASTMARMVAEDKARIQIVNLEEESRESASQKVRAAFGTSKIEFQSNATVQYNVTDRLFNLFYRKIPPSLFPAELQLDAYTWSEFHAFWLYIKTLCELRHYVLTMACTDLGGQTTAHNSGAIFIEAGEVRKMRHRVGLRYGPAQAIFHDLTYSPSVARDIIHQPLIKLTNTLYVTAPLLVYGSNHERNLLLIVDKLSARSAQAINDVKERNMLEELQPLFTGRGLHVRPRLRLGTPPHEIGDIDLLVWSADASVSLAISLKWFLGPDSVYEVRMHDEKFREALVVHKRCLLELEANKVEISQNFRLTPPLRPGTRILGAIISKMATPTEFVRDGEIPIVTSEELKACLRGDDLSELHAELRRVPENYPPIHGRDIYKELRFGAFLIRFPQFALGRD